MHTSIWEDSIKLPEFPKLQGDLKTDVLVIGGGICGLLCAYQLKQAGIDCALVEANRIASGVTAGTTAKITALHGLIYADLVKNFGLETAEKYYYVNQKAIADFAKIAKEAACDFEAKTAYTYSLQGQEKIEQEFSVLQRLGAKPEMQYASPLPIPFAAAVGLPNQGQFHPLKFLQAICKDLQIYEHTRVTEFTPKYVLCGKQKILANQIIVATHFPMLNKHGMYYLKLYQHRSYVLGIEGAPCPEGMYVDERDKGLSFRSHKGMLLLGGGGGRTGKPCGGWGELDRFRKRFYPESQVKFQWAAQDCISLDGMPLIGQYSPCTPNLYVATGFNKWGMTGSMAAANILTDMICGKRNECAHIFAPDRSIWKPQLAINCFESLTNFLYPTVRRCPHLGCALKWNKQERSWDCSCHGSRFAPDGKLLNNPANKDK